MQLASPFASCRGLVCGFPYHGRRTFVRVVKTDDQITNVYLKLLENKGETHSVELKFNFATQREFKVPIAQRGALSTEDSSLLTFLKDSFGVVDGDDTRIKFYPFSMSVRNPDGSETSKRTYEGIACAGDATGRPFSYAGSDNVFVSDNDPSGEYTILTESNEIPASGGANIRLNGKGYFDVRVFNNQGKSDFQMFFGAKNEDGRYRGAMQRTQLDDPDYAARLDSLRAAGTKLSKVQRLRPTNFYFTARPSASWPRCSRSIAAERIVAIGLAMFFPAACG